MGIAKIIEQRNGKKVVEFYQLEILEILKDQFGFRYAQIDKLKYFLQKKEDSYKIAEFSDLNNTFSNLIKDDFENLEIDGEIESENFLNEFYSQNPLKLNCARKVLSENFFLNKQELHQIKYQEDSIYSIEFDKQEMLAFLKAENFTETIDTIGIFVENNPLFYKKVSDVKFLLFGYSNKSKFQQPCFDFSIISVKSKNEFLIKGTAKALKIKNSFILSHNRRLYENELI